jgi:hypothetical protein
VAQPAAVAWHRRGQYGRSRSELRRVRRTLIDASV